MLEKRQKNKPTSPQQLDLVDSISQNDKLFTKRRLIAAALLLSVLSSFLFMVYGQFLKGKKLNLLTVPKFEFNLPSVSGQTINITSPSLPSSITSAIKFIDHTAAAPVWKNLTPAVSLEFSAPSDLDAKLTSPPANDPVISRLPSGLKTGQYVIKESGSLSYFISFNSPRHHFALAYKFIAPSDQIKSLEAKLPQIIESHYWEIVSQL